MPRMSGSFMVGVPMSLATDLEPGPGRRRSYLNAEITAAKTLALAAPAARIESAPETNRVTFLSWDTEGGRRLGSGEVLFLHDTA